MHADLELRLAPLLEDLCCALVQRLSFLRLDLAQQRLLEVAMTERDFAALRAQHAAAEQGQRLEHLQLGAARQRDEV